MILEIFDSAVELPPLSASMRRREHRAWLVREIRRIGARAVIEPDVDAGEISHATAAALLEALPEEPVLLPCDDDADFLLVDGADEG